jgi:hypothetical protein
MFLEDLEILPLKIVCSKDHDLEKIYLLLQTIGGKSQVKPQSISGFTPLQILAKSK